MTAGVACKPQDSTIIFPSSLFRYFNKSSLLCFLFSKLGEKNAFVLILLSSFLDLWIREVVNPGQDPSFLAPNCIEIP
jgi:hypothetical protein